LRRPRVADDRPTAQRARTELHPALHETDDSFVREERGYFIGEVAWRRTARLVAVRRQKRRDVLVGRSRAEKRAAHAVGELRRAAANRRRPLPRAGRLRAGARLPEVPVPQRQRDAHSAARVARGRLNPDLLEGPFATQASVADAVQRNAAGETQIAHSG